MKKPSWKDPSRHVSRIFVEESCLEAQYTLEILQRTGLEYTVVRDKEKPNDLDADFAANLSVGKKQLFLCRNRGQFFKPCPGTREYQCCDYQVLSTGLNCPIDCSYCILQAYLNTPWLTVYVNVEKMFSELDDHLKVRKEPGFYRIGTGEFADSLALDRITCLSRKLVPYFADKKNCVLELKTKSGVIGNLEGLDHNGRTVIAWSLNSTAMMEDQELRSATLEERLQAAKQCAEWGYRLAFHFDPIVEHPSWQQGYRQTIERLFSVVPAGAICWISLGALRFIPYLKQVGTRRFPASRIYSNEFVIGLDGKSRYFRPVRVELYSYIYALLKERAAERTCIYFCMESDEIWKEVFGFAPAEKGGLPAMLDNSVN
jgi:spore photoproduct lyase